MTTFFFGILWNPCSPHKLPRLLGLHGSKYDPSLSCSFGLCLFHRAASRLGATDPSLLWGTKPIVSPSECLTVKVVTVHSKLTHRLSLWRLGKSSSSNSGQLVHPRNLTARPWKMMVGRWVSFWDWLFLGAMLNFKGVGDYRQQFPGGHWSMVDDSIWTSCQVKPFFQNYFSYMSQKLSGCQFVDPYKTMKIDDDDDDDDIMNTPLSWNDCILTWITWCTSVSLFWSVGIPSIDGGFLTFLVLRVCVHLMICLCNCTSIILQKTSD